MNTRFFSWILYATVGAFFAVAAMVKVLDPEAFLSSLLTYRVFPQGIAVILALFAPYLELVVALCLMTGVLRKGATLLVVAMLLLFILLIGQGMVRGLDMDCGCFGSNDLQTNTDYFLKIGQNGLLLAAVFAARFFETRRLSQD